MQTIASQFSAKLTLSKSQQLMHLGLLFPHWSTATQSSQMTFWVTFLSGAI
jgi:hypothetical protein